jgi:hypothetical protein
MGRRAFARPADCGADGICTTLHNPALTDIKVDLIQVKSSTGDRIEPPACKP